MKPVSTITNPISKTNLKAACAVLILLLTAIIMNQSSAAAAEHIPTVQTEDSSGEAIPAPDYSNAESWVSLPSEVTHKADTFFILPTVNMKETTAGNEDIYDEKKALRFVKTFNMEKGIVDEATDVYAPYYRQTTLPCHLTDDGFLSDSFLPGTEEYEEIAYNDVRAAWLYYAENCNQNRPVVLFGYSQGGEMLLRLLAEFGDGDILSDHLIAAYVIGASVDEDYLETHPYLHLAENETDTGVIVSYNAMDERAQKPDTKEFAINPLNWRTDSEPASHNENLGYTVVDTWGKITEEIPSFCGAYLDAESGRLIVTAVDDKATPPLSARRQVLDAMYESTGNPPFAKGDYHMYDLNLFYRNLQKNVAARIESFCAQN